MDAVISFRHYLKTLLLSTIGLFILMAGAMLYLDPLQIFHKAPFSNGLFIKKQVTQNAGIINSYDFDSIILGTSMLENTSSNEASELLNSNFVNISIAGSRLSTRALVLNHALNNKDLKNVIISLDGFDKIGEYRDNNAVSDYDFLYNENKYDDIKVYSKLIYLAVAACQIAREYIAPCKKQLRNIETLNEWYSYKNNSKRFGGLDKWFEADNRDDVIDAFKQIVKQSKCIKNKDCTFDSVSKYDYVKVSFDEYIFKYAKSNPKTEFHLVFPPFSRLRYSMWSQANPAVFESYISAIRYIVYKSNSVNNIFVYGFDHLSFVDDISNYRDTRHFHPKINSMMLYAIKDKEHLLSTHTVDSYIKNIILLANEYDFLSMADKIQTYLENFLGEN